MTDLRYPVGRFQRSDEVTAEQRRAWVEEIRRLPDELRRAVAGLGERQLDTPYRDGGWTVRQVVHHLPDSHVNAYVRFKLALTEAEPSIKAYDEARWAELPDTRLTPVDTSLSLLQALHDRWTTLLQELSDEDWRRAFLHPENGRMTLDSLVQLYAWHGRHHVAHITRLREREGWA